MTKLYQENNIAENEKTLCENNYLYLITLCI